MPLFSQRRFHKRQSQMIPKIFASMFSVCNEILMICLREYNSTGNEFISYFVFPAERFTHAKIHFSPDISFA